MIDISCSIVTYNTNQKDLFKAIRCFLNTDLKIHLFISDNSPTNTLKDELNIFPKDKITYIFNGRNGGYGWGHNQVMLYQNIDSKYHLILNPDIEFKKGVLEELFKFLESNEKIGHVMPKVKYPDGELQYLCKRLPTPINLILRKFCPIKTLISKSDYLYEMRDFNYNSIKEIPILSGCFMLIRTNILKSINGFDERFFMYLEDYDLSRRINMVSTSVFYPYVEIIHSHAKGSFKNKKMLIFHVISAIKYFNKWGWIFDKYRRNSI
ncbi:glycosyltransferase family 2 protein [Cetobacterium sp. 2G large]|uniref:glycosyltransferase family 2 protein n=1 Tax=Cetobacterium sp. 2G large TaxID=2759680 RepID=UPI00163D2A6C|nr:glycosyltransferase family 2 protein [Cetobacterium sp. 2G large]MBC2852330.1 glycosyltransferase family 2 protein [Cetobacterium sp. 2G large]